MNLLAIDTSTNICSISLYQKEKQVDTKEKLLDGMNYSKILAVSVDTIMKKNDCSFEDINYFILSIGPGSYSGLRVGSSFIKGLAFGTGKSIIPINTIESMNFKLNKKENYFIANFSHKNYVYYQEFSKGISKGEQFCKDINKLEGKKIYGYGLEQFENINSVELRPSSVDLINYVIKNKKLIKKYNINKISPIYLSKSN
jgi:tRNA threonylcarbamoyl adenosine modification protein YeaZ